MAETSIEWATDVWNPIIGCSPISEGCKACYAAVFARRLAGMGVEGYADVRGWDGTTRLIEGKLEIPLHLRKPRRIFVGSMTDLFHPSTPAWWVGKVIAAMADAPQHTYMVLTKRADRMREYFSQVDDEIPWLWLGVSVENQARAEERIPDLLATPAALRFVSYEPALGPVDFSPWLKRPPRLNWVIAGAETGPHRREAELDWFRAARDACDDAGVPFFLKKVTGGARTLDGRRHEVIP